MRTRDLKDILLSVGLILALFVRVYLFMLIWKWTLVPLNFPGLNYWQSFGIVLLFGMLNHSDNLVLIRRDVSEIGKKLRGGL